MITRENYAQFVAKTTKNSPLAKNMLKAFLIGGAICSLGQLILYWLSLFSLGEMAERSWTSIILVFLAAIATGFGVYDKLAKHAGAGTIIPITGFSNSVSSAAMEFKKEGYILGVGAKIFTVAGPVLLYGTLASVLYGIFYWILQMV